MTLSLSRGAATVSIAVALAVSLASCSSSAGSPQAAHPGLRMVTTDVNGTVSGTVLDGAGSDAVSLVGAQTRCRGGLTPLVSVVGKGRPGHAFQAVVVVNGARAAAHRVTPDSRGRYALEAPQRNHARNVVEVLANGHSILRRVLEVACPAPGSSGLSGVTSHLPAGAVGSVGAGGAVGTVSATAPVPVAAAPAPAALAPVVAHPAPPAAPPAATGGGLLAAVPAVGDVIAAAAAPAASEIRGPASAYSVAHNNNGTVTRWDPCAGPIHVMVNIDQAHSGALQDVIGALARVAEASGLSFLYEGTTHYVPNSGGNQPAELVVAWASRGTAANQTDLYSPGAIGQGGWRSAGSSSDGTHWLWKIVSGFVVLDPAQDNTVAGGFGAGETRGSLLLHELGHAVGLDHSTDQSQVMYPTLTSTARAVYGAGDRAGLRAVGAASGCVAAA